MPAVSEVISVAVSFTAGWGEISAQPLPICFWISQPVIFAVTSQVASLLLEDDGAFVAAVHVIARLVVLDALAFVFTGGQGGIGPALGSELALPPAACAEAASSVPGTTTHAGGL